MALLSSSLSSSFAISRSLSCSLPSLRLTLTRPERCNFVVTKRSGAAVALAATLGLGSWEVWAGGAMVAVTGVLMASTSEVLRRQDEASDCISRARQLFKQGDVIHSVTEFDKALELDPNQRPYLWQRGVALYYANRFEEGANQFRDDTLMNPNDTEEAIWCFLCEAQVYGIDEARSRFLEVQSDRRLVMRKYYELFRYGGDTNKILGEFQDGGGQLTFYSHFYTGLFHEVEKSVDAAKASITTACCSLYGSRSSDYMTYVAKVHCAMRGWELVEACDSAQLSR